MEAAERHWRLQRWDQKLNDVDDIIRTRTRLQARDMRSMAAARVANAAVRRGNRRRGVTMEPAIAAAGMKRTPTRRLLASAGCSRIRMMRTQERRGREKDVHVSLQRQAVAGLVCVSYRRLLSSVPSSPLAVGCPASPPHSPPSPPPLSACHVLEGRARCK